MRLPSIRKELQLTPTQLGVVFSSFFLSYALLQIPWGVAADRYGPRKIVTFAILAWSSFTALTGAAAGYRTLVLIRFAFGGMEAALAPSIGSSLARWIPESWRATAFGIFLAGGRLGGAFAPALSALLLLHFGWRATFLMIATAGPVAALVWIRAAPSHPGTETVPKPPEQSEKLPRSFRVFALLLVSFGYTFMWQFYATWFPTYLIERRGYSLGQAAGYAALPFLLGIGSNWLGGLLSDVLSRKLGKPFGRGAVGFFSMFLAGLLFYFGIVGSARASVWLLAAAAGFGDLFLPIAWSVATELGGKSAGAFAALMNSASNLGRVCFADRAGCGDSTVGKLGLRIDGQCRSSAGRRARVANHNLATELEDCRPAKLKRFRNYFGLIKIARSGFPWEKTTKWVLGFGLHQSRNRCSPALTLQACVQTDEGVIRFLGKAKRNQRPVKRLASISLLKHVGGRSNADAPVEKTACFAVLT